MAAMSRLTQMMQRRALRKDLREAFKTAMAKAYPLGGVKDRQLRDLIWAFAMGWLEALGATGNARALHESAAVWHQISDPAWVPGDEWKWWK